MPGEFAFECPTLQWDHRSHRLEPMQQMRMLHASTGESYPDPASIPLLVSRAEKKSLECWEAVLRMRSQQPLICLDD